MNYHPLAPRRVLEVREIYTVHYLEYTGSYAFAGERHDFWELLYVDKGAVEVTAGERRRTLEQGQLIFHAPGEFHALSATGVAPDLVVVSFRCDAPEMAFFRSLVTTAGEGERSLLARIVAEGAAAFSTPLNNPETRALQRREAGPFGGEQLLAAALEELLIRLIRQGSVPAAGGRRPREDGGVLEQVTDRTCAILFETVQGEGGIYPATEDFMRRVRKLCDERDILMMLDEIQCGMGRTGAMFAWQRYGIRPDVMTVAKALGCGVPVGAFLMTEKVGAHSLVAGDHGSTYGGNPLACAAVSKVIDLFEKKNILANVQEVGVYLETCLDSLVEEFDCVKTRRGVGLLQGLVFDRPVGEIIKKAMDKGLVLINAGSDIIRFVPPLVITREHVDDMVQILRESIQDDLQIKTIR